MYDTKQEVVIWKRDGRGQNREGNDGSRPSLTHECGVFGAIGGEGWPNDVDIIQTLYIGIAALQHRGQESAGIVTARNGTFNSHKGMGLVSGIFDEQILKTLRGNMGIGHTRYSTCAKSDLVNTQPFVVHSMHGPIAVAHNGQLVNKDRLRHWVLDRGIGLQTHSDSELIIQALCLQPPEEGEGDDANWPARIKHVMKLMPLSYSLVIMLKDRIYAVRDIYGNRPLCLGRLLPSKNQAVPLTVNEHEAWIVSSESGAFLSHVKYVREVQPGEIVELTKSGIRTVNVIPRPDAEIPAFCIFEYVYFARPNSIFEGQTVYTVRIECGKRLAIEHPVEADIVSCIPTSGNAAAHGFATQSGIRFGEVLARSNYVGRTFIQPSQELRVAAVALKFTPIIDNVMNRRVVLIDDSIVRGNTIKTIITMVRDAGAKEIHVRIASPPLKNPCYMGINIPTKDELIANKHSPRELATYIGADSVEYLSVEGLVGAVQENLVGNGKQVGHCTACLTGKYPKPIYSW